MVMPQHFADLVERGTLAQHLGGQAMAELMCPRGGSIYAGPFERAPNDTAKTARSPKAVDRSLGTQEHAAAGTAWSPSPQICCDCFANVSG
jgi:hypothetical protein